MRACDARRNRFRPNALNTPRPQAVNRRGVLTPIGELSY